MQTRRRKRLAVAKEEEKEQKAGTLSSHMTEIQPIHEDKPAPQCEPLPCSSITREEKYSGEPSIDNGYEASLTEESEIAADVEGQSIAEEEEETEVEVEVDSNLEEEEKKVEQTEAQPKKLLKTGSSLRIKPKEIIENLDLSEPVSITTLTTKDFAKINRKTYTISKNEQKQLIHINSAKERSKIYNKAAIAIARREAKALPGQGARPWQCQVSVWDPMGASSNVDTTLTNLNCINQNKNLMSALQDKKDVKKKDTAGKRKRVGKRFTPLFRWFRGELELAVLPHLFQKIDVIDVDFGNIKTKFDLEDESDSDSDLNDEPSAHDLTERRITTVSTHAFEDANHIIPEVTRRWISPDHALFRSRKAVIHHCEELVLKDKLIDRVLHGFGKRGEMLRPVRMTRSEILEGGCYRFVRDGLWVVGQEDEWLDERVGDFEELSLKKLEKKVATEIEKERKISKSMEEGETGTSGDDTIDKDYIRQRIEEHPGKIEIKKKSEEWRSKIKNSSKPWRLTDDQILLCYNTIMEQYEKVMYTIKARALYSELADGFDIFRERGMGRYDMQLPEFDTPEFSFLTDLENAAWMEIVKKILGDDATLVHKGAFLSMPGSSTQIYHQDGVHLTTKYQRDCHAINVFIPLVELTEKNGPTEFCLGTHILGFEYFEKDMCETPVCQAGTPIIFDYRLGHRGLGNTTSQCRPIVYLTYTSASKEFRDSVNFSKKRYQKLGELIEKPMTRDERALKRRRERD